MTNHRPLNKAISKINKDAENSKSRIDEIVDTISRFFKPGPGRGARPAPQRADTNAAFAASDPKPSAQVANRAALNVAGASQAAARPAAPINPTAAARANIGDNSLGGDDTPPAMQRVQASRPTASRGLSLSQYASMSSDNDSNKPYQDQPLSASEKARAPQQAAAAMSTPTRSAATASRPVATPASSAPSIPANTAKMAPGAMTGGSFKPAAPERDPGTGELKSDAKDLSAISKMQNVPAPPPRPASLGAAKPAARPAAPPASSAPAQPTRSSQMFQAMSDKGDDATSADFVRADNQARAERQAAPTAPASSTQRPARQQTSAPQQSNADYLKSSGMMDESLEKKIRKMYREQKSEKFTGGVAADLQDYSGPNKPVGRSEKEQHHGIVDEENLEEIRGTATGFGGRHNPRRSSSKTTLGGERLKSRASMQRSGNQRMKNRYEEFSIMKEEAREKAFEKVKTKKDQMSKGNRTLTGSPADMINTEPTKPSMTGY